MVDSEPYLDYKLDLLLATLFQLKVGFMCDVYTSSSNWIRLRLNVSIPDWTIFSRPTMDVFVTLDTINVGCNSEV